MNSYGSFFVLANVFVFVSNAANICISMSGNTNIRFRGSYFEQGIDSNGNTYYKNNEANCDSEYIYNQNGFWVASDSLGSTSYYLQCPTRDILSPANCGQNWNGATSATSSSQSCIEINLNCNVIEISGYTSSINGAYIKVANNLYFGNNKKYFQYISRYGMFVVTDNDDRSDCISPPAYLRSYETVTIGNLKPGKRIVVSIDNVDNPTATIKCSTNAPTPLPAASAENNICISRDIDGVNNAFYGSYNKRTDTNGNLYYEKDVCDNTPEYVYLQNGKWVGSQTLYSSSYNIICDTSNIAAPYQCTTAWLNGNIGADQELNVASGSCPEFRATLGCNVVEITGTGTTSDGVYSKIGTNLYEKEDGKKFQRHERSEKYGVAATDSRLACSISTYLRVGDSYSNTIDVLTNGYSISVYLEWPVGTTATINCLTNAPTPLPAASAANNICISREIDGSNTAFYGTYNKKTEINGYLYYEKDACDSIPEYIYFQSGQWRASQTLYGSSTYLRCPASNVAVPYECTTSYINGGSSDPDLSVTSGACPEFEVILSCNAIEITGSGSSGTNGIYSKINTNLYQKSSNGRMFQRYERGEYYAVATTDSRLACSGPSAYLRTYDSGIDSLINGNSITVNLDYPVGGKAIINCLVSAF